MNSKRKYRNEGIKPPVSPASQKGQNNYFQLRPVFLFVSLNWLLLSILHGNYYENVKNIGPKALQLQFKSVKRSMSEDWGVAVYCMQIRNSWYVHLFFEPVFIHFGSIIIICFSLLSILFSWVCLGARRPFHFVTDGS